MVRRARRLTALALALALGTTVAGCATTTTAARGPEVDVDDGGGVPRVSLFSHPWTWLDEQGQPVTLSRWRGQPLVVTAMFTSCKATCPRTIAKMQELYARYRRQDKAQGQETTAQFLLVTLDPANDTPQRLLQFKRSSGLPAAWHFLVGGERETHEIVEALDVHIIDDGPHLMHDGHIVIFDGRGMPRRSFSGWGVDHEVVISAAGSGSEAPGPVQDTLVERGR